MAHPFARRLHRRPALLYGILDAGLCAPELMLDTGRVLARAGVDLLQLRGKDLSASMLLELARALLPVCRERGVPLIVNDRVDVALAAGVDGVHLGQEDLGAPQAREAIGPERLLGWSTHNLEEVRAAETDVDYLGFGAVFPSSTRSGSQIAGPQALTEAVEATTLPIFAIGGINAENLGELRTCGMAGIAVASALLGGSSRTAAVTKMRQALELTS